MAVQTPSHRLILGLVHNVHLIHSTVARNAGYTAVHVRRMIEIDIVGQPVNPDPVDRLPSPPTLPHRLQLRRFRMDRRQLWSPSRRLWTVAVDTRLRGRNLRMSRFVDRSVAVLAIHLQFPSMQRMAERNRLEWSVPRVKSFWARYAQEQNARVGTAGEDQYTQKGQEFIGPSGE